jgi:methyltransferase (TIGR00027 family)
MRHYRFDPAQETPLFEVPWEQDKEYRTNPQVLTTLLREQVPVLEFVNWKVTAVEPGMAESVLPLNPQSTNQHFTHQAALFLLAADYTGGIALGSLMTGWPVVGVHPVRSSKSIALWLIKCEIKYLRPSVTDLTISAEIEPERFSRILRRFQAGKAVLESIPVYFRNGSVPVAEAALTYFARQSQKLRADGTSPEKVNVLYRLKLTSSAELIAGVRARESGELFHDPYAAQMAEQHGLALADRFCQRSPQLGGMVAARTRHLDLEVLKYAARGGRNLVILGVGWDMRPFRLDLPAGMRVFEVDFPTTLAERRQRITSLGIAEQPGITRIEVPLDLRSAPLASALREKLDFQAPIFIAWEGMSMYFEEDDVRAILQGMHPLFKHRESRLWVDLVDRQAVTSPELFPSEVQEFMRGMQILGEPFTFGADSIKDFMADNGFKCHEVVNSDLFLNGRKDPVYSLYKFCVASGDAVSAIEGASFWKIHATEELPEPITQYQPPTVKT